MDERKYRSISELISVSVLDCFQEFLNAKRIENLSEATLEGYTIAGTKFISTLPEGKKTDEIGIQDYNHFIEILNADSRKNDVTCRTYCRNLSAFLHWAMSEQYCQEFRMKLPKASEKTKKVYSDDDLRKLLQKPPKGCSENTYQVWIFENLAITTGLRLRSLVHLRVGDLQGNQLTVRVTKTKQPLITTVNNECVTMLKQYFRLFGLTSENYMFSKVDGTRYSEDSFKVYVRDYNRAHGVAVTSIHAFRHSFAVRIYRQTRDVLLVQRALGHSSVNTTMRYLRTLAPEDFTEALLAYNPQAEFTQKPTRRRGRMKTA
ncbi:MAG: tyrosine-type recombinase/integrase [Eubacterium sp.]|nr:tyrosine-type recombinase/integrase [Eubacterium sp.]